MAKMQVRGIDNLQQLLIGSGHGLIADEPKEVGGDGLGPDPYDYLLAALGACTAMTVLMYARRKGMPLERVEVELDHERIHAQDCEDCETKEGRLDLIRRRVILHGTLDGEQRERLAMIAARCPVHQTLTSENHIQDEVVVA